MQPILIVLWMVSWFTKFSEFSLGRYNVFPQITFYCLSAYLICDTFLLYRVIPNRRSQPAAFRLYMELLKRHVTELTSDIKSPNNQTWGTNFLVLLMYINFDNFSRNHMVSAILSLTDIYIFYKFIKTVFW